MLSLLLTLFIFFNLVFVIAIVKKDFSIIDIAWSLSFILIYFVSWLSYENDYSMRHYLIGGLVFIWGIRLSGYLLYRSIKKGREDFRYAAWREKWGTKANQLAYLKIYLVQFLLSLIIGSPLFLIFKFSSKTPWGTLLDWLGISLWLIGFLFESIADHQKNKFKSLKENDNKFCNVGLWQYTRHPNYFGETLLWWGIFFISINIVPAYYIVGAPLLLTFLLVKITGVAMLEEAYEKRVGFQEYKKLTSRFIPGLKEKNE